MPSSLGVNPAEKLTSYGIELSKESLLAALNDASPEIRTLAAEELIYEKHDADAIPAIERALSDERDSNVGVEFATALLWAHDLIGRKYLLAVCTDDTTDSRTLLSAVSGLSVLKQSVSPCADTVINSAILDHDYRACLLSLLPAMYHEVASDEAARILGVLEGMLSDDQEPDVRLTAGYGLAQIGSISSEESIRDAMLGTDDAMLHSSFQSDLAMLEKKR